MATAPALPSLKEMRAAAKRPLQPFPAPQAPVVRTPVHTMPTGVGTCTSRRHITPAAGFALEALGHAIEYLADEYVHASGSLASVHSTDPRVEAMQILMAANRQVYYECPLMSSLYQRVMSVLFGD